MSDVEAARKGVMMQHAVTSLARDGARGERIARIWVPGRIEFLGKHTDYAGGRSLLCAAERGMCTAAAARDDGVLRVTDAATGDVVTVRDGELASPRPAVAGDWSNYVLTVARRLALNFPNTQRGAEITFESDIPLAAGMSSSSALVTSIFLAISAVGGVSDCAAYKRNITTREDLAEYLGAVENGESFRELAGELGVGTFGGSEDHTAMLCAQAGMLVQYSFCPVTFERAIPFPRDHVLVVLVSGVVAAKTGAAREAYNGVSRLARQALGELNAATNARHATVAGALRDLDRRHALEIVSDDARARLEQFALESCDIVPAAGDALSRGDLAALGHIVARSQEGAERLLGNQTPETSFLASEARAIGAVAASAFGAGFGGSVWALVRENDAPEFAKRWMHEYEQSFPAVGAERGNSSDASWTSRHDARVIALASGRERALLIMRGVDLVPTPCGSRVTAARHDCTRGRVPRDERAAAPRCRAPLRRRRMHDSTRFTTRPIISRCAPRRTRSARRLPCAHTIVASSRTRWARTMRRSLTCNHSLPTTREYSPRRSCCAPPTRSARATSRSSATAKRGMRIAQR